MSMLHCVAMGHQPVALANIHPTPQASTIPPASISWHSLLLVIFACVFPLPSDEMDSYMYQTVGHESIDLIAQALRLPLYRAQLEGIYLISIINFN